MEKALLARRLVKAGICLGLLVYFAAFSDAPKIIFLPFLLCGAASFGKALSLLLGSEKAAAVFGVLFSAVFFLGWFGFLVFACCFAVKEQNYQMLLFSLPFWAGGLFFAKRRLFGKKQ
ncbi:MAG: hypothetical protein IKV55_01675 [Oscillospiraceae bacterium]|nr:hypothetical protein [Oscillospiraceae bacterium]